jgi:CRISPR-associated protein Cmr3
VLVSVPAVLHGQKKSEGGNLHRLSPLRVGQLPGWDAELAHEQRGLRPLWLASKDVTEPARGYLTLGGLAAFLRGDTVERNSLLHPEDLFTFDHRTGIGVHPDRLAAEESQIYGASFLALRSRYTARELHEEPRELPEVVLYAEVTGAEGIPPDALADLALPLGGEGRRVAVRAVDPIRWPEEGPRSNQKPLLLLTTPGLFQGRWRPGCLDGQLVAAAVPTPVAVSGWDLARGGPKPTRFAAPAGSVYFFDSLPDSLPETLSDKPEDGQQGWGCYVQGVWTDA